MWDCTIRVAKTKALHCEADPRLGKTPVLSKILFSPGAAHMFLYVKICLSCTNLDGYKQGALYKNQSGHIISKYFFLSCKN